MKIKQENCTVQFNGGLKIKVTDDTQFVYNHDKVKQLLNKDTPKPLVFTPAYQNYYSAGDDSEILCPNCECSLDEYDIEDKQFRYCPECGQKLMTIDEMRSNNR